MPCSQRGRNGTKPVLPWKHVSRLVTERCPDFLLPGQAQSGPEESCLRRSLVPLQTPGMPCRRLPTFRQWRGSCLLADGTAAPGAACIFPGVFWRLPALPCPGWLAGSCPAQDRLLPRKGASDWPGTCRRTSLSVTELHSTGSQELHQSGSPRSPMTLLFGQQSESGFCFDA